MRKKKVGSLITNGVALKKHEMETVRVFLELGKDVELIVPSCKEYCKTADLKMDGLVWESKSPKGRGKHVMRDTMVRAIKQSRCILIDLRRTPLLDEKCLRDLRKYLGENKAVKHLKVVTKRNKVIDLK